MKIENFEEVKELMKQRKEFADTIDALSLVELDKGSISLFGHAENGNTYRRFDSTHFPSFHSLSRDLPNQVLEMTRKLLTERLEEIDAEIEKL